MQQLIKLKELPLIFVFSCFSGIHHVALHKFYKFYFAKAVLLCRELICSWMKPIYRMIHFHIKGAGEREHHLQDVSVDLSFTSLQTSPLIFLCNFSRTTEHTSPHLNCIGHITFTSLQWEAKSCITHTCRLSITYNLYLEDV